MPEKQDKPLVHNRTGYTSRGCRCNICVEANREYQRRYMEKWRQGRKKSKVSS